MEYEKDVNSLKEAILLSQQILKGEDYVCNSCGSDELQVNFIATKRGWSHDEDWPVYCRSCSGKVSIIPRKHHNDLHTIKDLNTQL